MSHPSETDRHPRRRWPWVVATVAVLVVSFVVSDWLLQTQPQAERRPMQRQARLVDAQPLTQATHQVIVEAYGEVEASQRVSLTARVSGVVQRISDDFVPGEQVRAGDPLLWLEPDDFKLALADAQADLTAAEASLAQERGSQAVAEADFKLLDLDVTETERALMLRSPQRQAAEAAVAAAQANVKQAELSLERTVVRAPFNARIISRDVGVGSQVGGSGSSLGTVVAATPYWVELLVSVDRLQWLDWSREHGSRVELVDASRPGIAPWQGRLVQLLDEVESEGRRARVLVEVDPRSSASAEPLLLGTYVQAKVYGAQVNDSLSLEPGWLQGRQLWVVRDHRLAAVTVEIVHRGDHQVVALGDIEPGDQVVTSLLAGAVEGMQVRVPGDEPVEAPADTPRGGPPDAAGSPLGAPR